jgi:uncharacterized coiled-coil protein SlyX
MSNDAVGGLLRGFNNGLTSGLEFYKTIQGEERYKREEQYRNRRDARRDMEADRGYEFDREKFSTANEQWERNFEFEGTKHADNVKHQSRLAGIQEKNAQTSAGYLGLANRQYSDSQAEKERLRTLDNAEKMFSASLVDGDGQYITDDATYAEVANKNPQVIKALLDVAAARGLLDPKRVQGYTGAQLVPTPKGLALRVAGTDATGKPIKAGGGILSENGTDDPNDPYVLVNVGQLRQIADPNFRGAQRSAALARDQVAGYTEQNQALEQETTASLSAALAQQEQAVKASEERLATLQAEREQQPNAVSTSALAGGIGGGAGVPRTNPRIAQLDTEIASLSKQLEQGRATLGNLSGRLSEVPNTFGAQREQFAGTINAQSRLHGEQYAANTLASALKYPEQQQKAVKAADEGFGKAVENVLKDNVFKPRKGEPGPKVSAAEFRTLLTAMPAEVQRKIGGSAQYQSALYDVANHMAKSGVAADPVFMLEARAAGADLGAYTEYLAAPQNAGRDIAQVHAEAVEIGKQKAANPSASTATLSGALRMQ